LATLSTHVVTNASLPRSKSRVKAALRLLILKADFSVCWRRVDCVTVAIGRLDVVSDGDRALVGLTRDLKGNQ
jgi:hypothetical protein